PWGLAAVVLVSAATYLAGKYAEVGRPVILSVVRAREAGDLDAPIRTGDDIEIRGTAFVPPGAQGAERLSRMVVRVGAVNVHVPLVPVAGGFDNPTDTLLTVPVPAEVEPGRVELQVVPAAGCATRRYAIAGTDSARPRHRPGLASAPTGPASAATGPRLGPARTPRTCRFAVDRPQHRAVMIEPWWIVVRMVC